MAVRFSNHVQRLARVPPVLCSSSPSLLRCSQVDHFRTLRERGISNDSDDAHHDCEVPADDCALPEVPTNCCMSGCANCVWVKYAEEVIEKFEGGSDIARDTIMKNVQDPNMRAFLELELRLLTK